MTTRIGRNKGRISRVKDLPIGGSLHHRRFVDISRDGIEKAFHQPDIDAHRAAQVHQESGWYGCSGR